ncbi:uncharacterized protein LOC129580712 [Paramacrobiotus metropolitanus]|uniref:uncharacterized protein LOC129580712 n=1 Tax=Paramacrobiotus metropolitanus TaxID=2943436 RepID=UPI0024463F97|nr:uncharacterized protein LOC129580712 [Paramacrobiotus metropolitanus]
MAKLFANMSFKCSGIIIDPSFVLTAAQCLCDRTFPMRKKISIAPAYYAWRGTDVNVEQLRAISQVHFHPGFSCDSSIYGVPVDNVALLELAAPIPNEISYPINCRHVPWDSVSSKDVEVAGWGKIDIATGSPALRAVKVDLMPLSECRIAVHNDQLKKSDEVDFDYFDELNYYERRQICDNGSKNGLPAGSAQGDSGGPVILRLPGKEPMLLGVISGSLYEPTGEQEHLGVNLNISFYIDWITDVIALEYDTKARVVGNGTMSDHGISTSLHINNSAVIAPVALGCGVFLIVIIAASLYCRRKAKMKASRLQTQRDAFAEEAAEHLRLETDDTDRESFGSDCVYSYRPSDYFAKGSYGRLYIATINDPITATGEKELAVKVTHFDRNDHFVVQDEEWAKLLARWRMLIKLRCDNVVTYHKVSIIRARRGVSVEFLMDYCSGGDLSTALSKIRKNKACLEWGRSLRYAIQIVNGLEFLHSRRLIHGDLKPGNVFLQDHAGQYDTVLIGDLDNLVLMQSNITSTADMTHLRGTTRYMSPEMLKRFGEEETPPPGRATDIWSLGCIMHDLFDSSSGISVRILGKAGCSDFIVFDHTIDASYAMKIMEGFAPVVNEHMAPCYKNILQACLISNSKSRPRAETLRTFLLPLVDSTTATANTDTLPLLNSKIGRRV